VVGAEAVAVALVAAGAVRPWPGPQPVWPVEVEEEVVAETAMPTRYQATARKVDPWT
jgi:hypothetical protein